MQGRSIQTRRNRKKILDTLQRGWSITAACKLCKVAKSAVYAWRDADPTFKKDMEEAVESGTDMLEDEAARRAYRGVLEPVYQSGVLVGYKRKYSDGLLEFLLEGRRREKFHPENGTPAWGFGEVAGPRFVMNNVPPGVKPPAENENS